MTGKIPVIFLSYKYNYIDILICIIFFLFLRKLKFYTYASQRDFRKKERTRES